MVSRTLLRLALVVVVVILAVWLSTRRAPESGDLALGPVLPGLSERVNAVQQVTIQPAGGNTATLVRGDAGWTLRERHDWPADTGKLRDYLLRLGVTQRIEAKTQRPESYPRLGVQDLDAADANGARIDILGGGEPLALIVGQNNPQGHGSYVRVPGQAQSWLADLDIAPERQLENWLQRDLIDIDPRRIVSIRVQPAGKAAFALSRTAVNESHWQLAPIPAKRDTAQVPAEAIAGFLQGLRLDDVEPAADAEALDGDRVQFETADGLQVTLSLWQRDDKSCVSLAATFDEVVASAYVGAQVAAEQKAREQQAHDAANTDASAPPAATEPPATDAGSVEQRVTKLREQAHAAAARFDGWVFAISPFKASNLRKPHTDYIAEAK
jgi:hypothetical protein